jgi:hypothetical protein
LKVLLDHNVPVQLKPLLEGHSTSTAREMQWDRLANGDLLAAAEAAAFDVLITGDQNIAYQHDNSRRIISLVVISQTRRKLVLAHNEAITEAITRARPGSYERVPIPTRRRGIRAVE